MLNCIVRSHDDYWLFLCIFRIVKQTNCHSININYCDLLSFMQELHFFFLEQQNILKL
jgi:hypothetical protein